MQVNVDFKKNRSYIWLICILLLALILRLGNLKDVFCHVDESVSICLANGISDFSFSPFLIDDGHGNLIIKDTVFTSNVDLQKKYFTQEDFKNLNTSSNIINAVVNDNGNRIFYIFLLNTWFKLFGVSIFSMKWMSIITGLGTVFLTFLLARSYLSNHLTAMIASFLVAIHPTMIWLDVLGLTYSLSIFLGVLASFILLSYFSENTKRKHLLVFLYFICATLCLLSHYFTIFILMAHGLIVLFKFGFKRIALFYYLAISAALVTFYVGWFMKYGAAGNMIMQIQNGYWLKYAKGFGIGENQWLPPTSLKYFFISYIQSLILYLGNNYQNIVSLKFSILISIPVIAAIFINLRRNDLSKNKLITIALISLMPIFASMLFSLTSGHLISSEVKYLSFSIPFFCIFLGYCYTPSIGKRLIYIMMVFCVTPTLVYDIFLTNIKEDDTSVKFVSMDKLSENNFNPKSDTLIFNNWHDAACSDIMFPSKPLILHRVSESDIDVYKISHPR